MADIEEWRDVVQDASATLSPAPHDTDPFGRVDIDAVHNDFSPEPTSYFPNYVVDDHVEDADPAAEESFTMPSWPPEDPFPDPCPEKLMDTVQPRLLSHPQKPLEIRYIPMLGYIFEGYRNLIEEKDKVERLLQEETKRFLTLEKQYENEIHLLKIDKKELEITVAQGNGGVATMRLTREISDLRRRTQGMFDDDVDDDDDSHKESEGKYQQEVVTAQEFLDKSRRSEDESWASLKEAHRRSLSPSFPMQLLSKKLSEDDTPYPALPDGTVPMRGPSTLAQASVLQKQLENADSNNPTRVALLSDFHADEPSRLLAARAMAKKSMLNLKEHLVTSEFRPNGDDDDLKAIKRLAKSLSKRRGLDIDAVLPKLIEAFSIKTESNRKDDSVRADPFASTHMEKTQYTQTSQAIVVGKKVPGLKAKASGLLQKLKAQPSREAVVTPTTPNKRSSFECSDDGATRTAFYESSQPQVSDLNITTRKRGDSNHNNNLTGQTIPVLTSATFSPIVPTSGEVRKRSRIPTPTYNTGNYAQPRREREDSLSSLLTALKYPTSSPMHQEDTVSGFTSSSFSEGRFDEPVSPLANKRRQARKPSLMDRTNNLAYSTGADGNKREGNARRQSLHMARVQGNYETITGNRGNVQGSTYFPSLMSYSREATAEEYKSSAADDFGFTD